MARPVKIKDSPNRQYVARIPRDVLDKARGQIVAVEIDGRPVSYRIGPTGDVVKFSLRASDPTLVRSRHLTFIGNHWAARVLSVRVFFPVLA